MEEARNLSLEWNLLMNLVQKIGDTEETIDGGWPELIDMVLDAVDDNRYETDPEKLFLELHDFLFRVYYRVKNNPTNRPFNQISKVNIGGEEYYRITNYNYVNYKWAIANKFHMRMATDYNDIPIKDLTDKQRASLERRCAQE